MAHNTILDTLRVIMSIDRAATVRVMFGERLRLMAYFTTITRDRQDAEDIYQELSVAALEEAENLIDQQYLRARIQNRARFTRSIMFGRMQAVPWCSLPN